MTEATGPTAPRPQQPGASAGPDDGEEVYFEGSPVPRAFPGRLLLGFVAGMALMAAPVVVWVYAPAHAQVWWMLLAFLAGLGVMFVPALVARSTHYRITSYRIDYERGLLSKSIDTLELWHVDDIRFRQSLWQRVLKTGNITVVSNDSSTPALELYGIPRPRPIFESLKERIIAVKRQRGVIKIDGG